MSLTIGARLKNAREAKGLSLEDAGRITKVQLKTLRAIEEDRLHEILEPTYAKIFLRNYAQFLGLDGQVLAEEYMSQHGLAAPPKLEEAFPADLDRIRVESIQKYFLIGGTTILFLVGFSFLLYLGFDLAKRVSPDRSVRPPAGSSRLAAKAGPAAKAPAGATTSSKRMASSGLLVPRSQPLKLTVRTKADVWMQVKSDGSVIFQNVLAKGSQESWTATRELELWTGNAGAMELTLNGKPLGSPGTGVKKGIKVTHAGLTE